MQKFLLKIIFGVGLLIACHAAKPQAFTASYIYDLNGNRTKATVIYLTTSLKSAIIKDTTDSAYTTKQGWGNPNIDSIGGLTIKLYPNPTHGIILFEIFGADETQIANTGNKIEVFDINSHQILHISSLSTYNHVDLSTLHNGIYFVKITLAGKVKDYKIIKN